MVYKIIKRHWPPALLLLVFLKSFHNSNPSTRLCEPPQLDAPASLHLPQAVLKTDMLRRKKCTHSKNLGRERKRVQHTQPAYGEFSTSPTQHDQRHNHGVAVGSMITLPRPTRKPTRNAQGAEDESDPLPFRRSVHSTRPVRCPIPIIL